MGMLFTTPETARLCQRLNRRFSDDNLDAIRGKPKRLAKFLDPANNKRTLARIAYKSGTYPANDPKNPVAKRWFYFLQNLPATVAMDIRVALKDGLTTAGTNGFKYSAMVFIAFEGPAVVFATEDIAVVDGGGTATGDYIKLFKLQTAVIGQTQYDPTEAPDTDEDVAHEPNEGPVPDP